MKRMIVRILYAVLMVFQADARAGGGVVEISQACALNGGCFPGDSAGFPVQITQPGSYVLTGNLDLSGLPGTGAIEIANSGVTLDLGGFSVIGPESGTDDGIAVLPGGLGDLRIASGVVRGWGDDGVDAGDSGSSHFEGLRVTGSGGSGLKAGTGGVVLNVTAAHNSSHGVRALLNTVVKHSAAYQNTGNGFQVGRGSVVTHVTAGNNQGHGVFAPDGAVNISDSSAYGNTGAGIYIDTDAGTISNCTASTNGLAGLAGEFGTTIVGSTGESNIGPGITGQFLNVLHSTAADNGNNGIAVSDGSTVRDSVSRRNVGSGITAGSHNLILHNQVMDNGQIGGDQAGILVTGSNNRIEGNFAVNNDARGIDVDGVSNVIVKNHAYANSTNYDIEISNDYGPLVTLGGGALSTADPYANFED